MRCKQETLTILLLVLIMYATVLKLNDAASAINATFEDTVNTEKFNHLVVDKRTGRVYIGAVNRLYQLTANLKLEVSEKMGPMEDSPDCPVSKNCPSVTKKLTDYVNKALLIDYVNNSLIICGSLFQGVCQIRSMDNISIAEEPIKEAVVANNATASTVAFIAPGPPNSATTFVMYVGATLTGNGPYRQDVPAMSSRSLDSNNLFQLASTTVTTGTRMTINSLARESYPITYVYGFSSEGFSYFVSVQKQGVEESAAYISKLVRVCHSDQHYYSHTEVPLECWDNTSNYNLVQAAYLGKPGLELSRELGITLNDDVLFAVFSKSHWENNLKPSTQSALCVYSLKSIRVSFMNNIKDCYAGKGDRGLDFINPSVKCQNTLIPINENFCGTDVNTPLGGKNPIKKIAAIVYPYDTLTSVASVPTHDYTVVFLGTFNGDLKKVVLESSSHAIEYGNLTISKESPVDSDLVFDRNSSFLYVMSDRKVNKIRVQECGKFNTCTECLGSKDPYCGWCSLENKCKLRSECSTILQDDPLNWLSYRTGKCTVISNVEPKQIQRTTARKLSLTIENLPTLQGQFLCVFTVFGKTMITNATRSSSGVSCPTPRTDELPAILPGEHHFVAQLSVRIKVEPEFVSTNFTFYDCNSYSSCTSCVSSPFPCDWCVEGHRCTHNTGEYCRKDYLITGVSSTGSSIRSGSSFCPRINSTSKEILISSGMNYSVSVQAINIQPFQTRFHCNFNLEGRIKHANAQLSGETITCEVYPFSYASFSPNSTATFAVSWSGNKPLDNPDFIHLTIYKCTAMASNCGLCLELDPKFNCGWCESMCHVKTQCIHRAWLDRSATCPDPQITQFHPMTGPWEGGTELTIEGINLGKTFGDIKSGVMVAGIPCEPIEELYERTSKIVCRTDTIGTNEPLSGKVVVKVNDYEGMSAFKFTYMDPKIRDISPTKGPKSGGTKVTISGEYMNAGSNITASIGGNPCLITSKYTTDVVCITSWGSLPQNGSVVMQFDRGRRFFTGKLFYYSEDPTIVRVSTSASLNKDGPTGFPSGGILVSVEGTNLDSIQDPKIAVIWNGKSYESPCDILSPTEMRCRGPILTAATMLGPVDYPVELDYGFIMDNVTVLKNLTALKFKPYVLYPDPSYKPFVEKEGIKYSKSDYLTINGENLDGCCKESDVTVQIGVSICNVTALTTKQITCRPPSNQPAGLDDKSIPLVVVTVGNLNYTIGYLSYATPTIFDGGLPRPIIIGITVGGGILLIIVVIILIAYRRKSTESSRVLKNMQEQMDVLELRVASECKEAFAELQTEMTDFTNDLSSSGIPFLDYRSYSMKVLFPNVEDHPVLRDTLEVDPLKKTHTEKGLRLFGQLIMNKTFLLLFIRTLESNRYFSMRDRVNVASLIMVTLQGKMEYCTDILKTLLAELIERCLEGRSHPKLLLRRTESVAEKMLSAWFTFLLYKFLKECAGEPLFLLYRAIKQQVDKGPVDAITSEARYSLSEEKLIRQQIEYKSMTVYVLGLEPQTENIETPVKVICCDIVSQVKEKALDAIYKNTPYSQRPNKEDLDLEWRTGNSGRLILQDEDMTTKPEGEYKRLNTLAHYKVPDLASLTLVPKQSSIYNMSIISDKSEKSHKYTPRGNQPMAVWAIQENFSFKTSSSPPLSRATSPMNHDLETGFKLWHLVKQHDADATKEGERSNKMVSEIYLTRLLATKGTLQKFVDDLFETIFSTAHRGSALPLAIKYMFDFLDDQALQHVISDPEVVHTWKSNSLPLRFWVNLIKNPNFVFDINKSNIVDSCLSVVAQTFMDSCSTSDHRLGKDSPSSKLLYAKDIPVYKDWVERYYQDIKLMPAISDQDMNAMLAEESRLHQKEFNVNSAVYELYKYAIKYNDQLIQTLEEDEFSKKNRLAYKLEQIHHIMSGESEA